ARAARGLPLGAVSSIEDTGTVLAAPTTRPAGALPTRTVQVDGRSLSIAAGDPDDVGLTTPTVALAVLTLVAGLLTAVLVAEAATRLRAHRRAAERRGAQVRLIGDVAPIVQQSLELGEVLPAVAVQLSDHFGLAGVSLSAGSSRAEQTQLFSLGVAPEPDVSAVLRSPSALAAGDTLTLALQRGGRSVALLQIVAGRRLEATELESLQALTELVTAALVNASLYASQQEALVRMRELDGLKTVFLGTASHELRTPATAIAGFASLLASSWDRFSEEERRDFVGRIAGNARSLSAVVQDLLDFSVLDRSTLPVALRPIDLGPLVESVVHRLGPAFTDHRIDCTTETAPLVGGDQNGLERVTTNLLTNAVKFSPPGSTITVTVGPAGDGAALVVADEGPGIPAAEREQVFTRFYRGTGAAVVQTRGVGIGLSVVAEFVTRMGGDVVVDDAPGGGARFTVRIPAARPPAQEEVHDATTA
ncbi:MAG: HAMP domain-containing sensor histidine kinase, partial [Acidimicrobiales bacterium]